MVGGNGCHPYPGVSTGFFWQPFRKRGFKAMSQERCPWRNPFINQACAHLWMTKNRRITALKRKWYGLFYFRNSIWKMGLIRASLCVQQFLCVCERFKTSERICDASGWSREAPAGINLSRTLCMKESGYVKTHSFGERFYLARSGFRRGGSLKTRTRFITHID